MSRGFRDADATQQMSGREADVAIKRIQSAAASQAEHAAELRARGAYGVCESCGGAIDEDRLAAVPDATRCVPCQSSWETGHPPA